jgi:hypothetical protein
LQKERKERKGEEENNFSRERSKLGEEGENKR